MNLLLRIGRVFYGIAIVVYGIQQIVVRDFRPQLVPPFPAWAHAHPVLPVVLGMAFMLAGTIITGVLPFQASTIKKVSLCLGLFFLLLIVCCHLPYILVVSPNSISHLGVWVDMLKALAFCGGAFVLAGSYPVLSGPQAFYRFAEIFIPIGRLFFCTTMVLFGYSHFLYTAYVAVLVPTWFGMPTFWTYFAGAALMASGLAIALNLFTRPVALLLAAMLFLWFTMLHVPRALVDPRSGNGNEVVSAFDALLFCGVALVIAATTRRTNSIKQAIA